MNKALLISEIFPPINGGSGRWFWDLYSRLPKESYSVVAGATSGSIEHDRDFPLDVERLNLSSEQWGFIHLKGALFYLKTFWEIRKLVKQKK